MRIFFLSVISAAFRGLQPAGRSPMRSSRRSLSYVTIKAVIDSVSHQLVSNQTSPNNEEFCRNTVERRRDLIISELALSGEPNSLDILWGEVQ